MAKRLIDSAELIAKLPIVEEDKQISLIGAVADVVTMISECHAVVDAVEVVRCRGCKHYKIPICEVHSEYPDQYTTGHTAYMEPDDFCSYGERKEGGKDGKQK